jgi:DNA recombination protein RmuC
LGNTLRAANNHYNETVTGLVGKQGLYGKIERFQQVSTKANKEMVALEPIHDEIDDDRLETVIADPQTESEPQRLETDVASPTKITAIGTD